MATAKSGRKGEKRDEEKFVKQWMNRIEKGEKVKQRDWEDRYEVARCKDYWSGQQLDDPYDEYDQRRVQINRVHPAVRSTIPSLYFHEPFARVHPSPALADTPGQRPGMSLDDKGKLLQD